MAEEPGEKFPESIWKFSVYTVTWMWALYLVMFGEHNYFFNLRSHWASKWYDYITALCILHMWMSDC